MARKKSKKKDERSSLINLEASLKKLSSMLVEPETSQWMMQNAKGIRERLLKINFRTLRNAVDKVPLINGIINTRVDQAMPFCHFTTDVRERGFTIVPIDPKLEREQKASAKSEVDDKVAAFGQFFEQTGFIYDPEREDDLMDYVQQVIRETLTIDQIATEMQYNRAGELAAFWLLDGATVFRVTDDSDFSRNIRFVQKVDDEVVNKFTAEELIFDYKYKRADLRYRGYGYSPVEQVIDIMTTLLFGYNYIRDQLIRDKMPKGFIQVMGDVGKPQLDAIRSYWYSAMTGAGAQWNLPILPSGKDGVGIDFKNLGQSNRDMEYHKTMMFVSSLIAAVYSFDLAEMGIKSDDSQPLFAANQQPRIENSKSRGLNSLLSFIEQHMNKILRKISTDYRFEFTGIDLEEETKKTEIKTKQITTTRTINEIREEDGLPPLEDSYADVVLNPQAVQIYLADKQAEQAEAMGGGMGEGPEGYDEEGGGFPGLPGMEDSEDEGPGAEDNEGRGRRQGQPNLMDNDMNKALDEFRKLTRRHEKTIHHVIDR